MADGQAATANRNAKRLNARQASNDILARIGRALHDAREEARQVAAEYKAKSQKINQDRHGSGEYGKTLWLDLKIKSAGPVYAYWRVMSPLKGGSGFVTDHIKTRKGRDPYPWEQLSQHVDDRTAELVHRTERKVRELERVTKALVKASQLIRDAIEEDTDDEE